MNVTTKCQNNMISKSCHDLIYKGKAHSLWIPTSQ